MECLVQNVKINYEICGEGIPILMIHGWGTDHLLMKGCMEPIFKKAERKWKCIYFDLHGMGKTKGEFWIDSSDKMLDLVLNFIDAIIPNRQFVLAGESYGGYIARGIINKRSSYIIGLLLICPATIQETSEENRPNFQVFEKDMTLLNSLTKEERENFESEGIIVIRNKRVWERYKSEVLSGIKDADNVF